MNIDLTGQTALITGASRGIARRFFADWARRARPLSAPPPAIPAWRRFADAPKHATLRARPSPTTPPTPNRRGR